MRCCSVRWGAEVGWLPAGAASRARSARHSSAAELFANLRPAILYPGTCQCPSLKPEIVAGLDILIVRELTGDIYFGQPRGIRVENGERVGFNTMIYSESEIRRIGKVAFGCLQAR